MISISQASGLIAALDFANRARFACLVIRPPDEKIDYGNTRFCLVPFSIMTPSPLVINEPPPDERVASVSRYDPEYFSSPVLNVVRAINKITFPDYIIGYRKADSSGPSINEKRREFERGSGRRMVSWPKAKSRFTKKYRGRNFPRGSRVPDFRIRHPWILGRPRSSRKRPPPGVD